MWEESKCVCIFECTYICVSVSVGLYGVVEEYVQLCTCTHVYTCIKIEKTSVIPQVA